jgi:Na+/glutamate symporter
MDPTSNKQPSRRRLSHRSLNVLSALVGIVTLALGVGWLIYNWMVNLEVPYFAIPLVLTVPVIAAVAFRNMWD